MMALECLFLNREWGKGAAIAERVVSDSGWRGSTKSEMAEWVADLYRRNDVVQ